MALNNVHPTEGVADFCEMATTLSSKLKRKLDKASVATAAEEGSLVKRRKGECEQVRVLICFVFAFCCGTVLDHLQLILNLLILNLLPNHFIFCSVVVGDTPAISFQYQCEVFL